MHASDRRRLRPADSSVDGSQEFLLGVATRRALGPTRCTAQPIPLASVTKSSPGRSINDSIDA